MILGLLSDTHNNTTNLQKALAVFRARGIETLIHCGDMTSAETAQMLGGFRVICVFGNGDYASGEIRAALLEMNPENYAGLFYTGSIDGARIAVTHGHLPGKVEELVRSAEYDYVFKGHSHQHIDETIGTTRLINPGALGGLHRDDRYICLLNLESGQAEFIKID